MVLSVTTPSAQHLVVPTLVLFLVFFGTPLPAQDTDTALPECTSVADDPDGDGFGWVVLTQSSCRVTDNTSAAPQRVNRETGQPVLLERAYWDANADFDPNAQYARVHTARLINNAVGAYAHRGKPIRDIQERAARLLPTVPWVCRNAARSGCRRIVWHRKYHD